VAADGTDVLIFANLEHHQDFKGLLLRAIFAFIFERLECVRISFKDFLNGLVVQALFIQLDEELLDLYS